MDERRPVDVDLACRLALDYAAARQIGERMLQPLLARSITMIIARTNHQIDNPATEIPL